MDDFFVLSFPKLGTNTPQSSIDTGFLLFKLLLSDYQHGFVEFLVDPPLNGLLLQISSLLYINRVLGVGFSQVKVVSRHRHENIVDSERVVVVDSTSTLDELTYHYIIKLKWISTNPNGI